MCKEKTSGVVEGGLTSITKAKAKLKLPVPSEDYVVDELHVGSILGGFRPLRVGNPSTSIS